MNKILLTGIAALLLATGTAHADSFDQLKKRCDAGDSRACEVLNKDYCVDPKVEPCYDEPAKPVRYRFQPSTIREQCESELLGHTTSKANRARELADIEECIRHRSAAVKTDIDGNPKPETIWIAHIHSCSIYRAVTQGNSDSSTIEWNENTRGVTRTSGAEAMRRISSMYLRS
jgi:hypothetical protein